MEYFTNNETKNNLYNDGSNYMCKEMNYNETLDYIHGINRYAKKLGLENIRRLMHELGDPQDRLNFVHIAGTNGKGSTAAFTASVMREAGYKTGLYTSPYLQRFTERIRVDGKEIPECEVARLAGVVRSAIGRIIADSYQHPTELEVVAAIAFLYFAQENCDVIALEVGLGGRMDPTNVIKTPLAAVITTIDYDHVARLGNTLELIASEKAGIIKPGGDAVLYPQPDSVRRVFEKAAEAAGAKLTVCDFASLRQTSYSARGQRFDYGCYENLEISMLGDYQMYNAALVAETVDVINRSENCGLHISEDALRRGLKNARWPGRMELLGDNPAVLIDAAHNAQCARALRDALLKYFPDRERILIFGVVREKDYSSIIDAMLPIASAVFTVTTGSPRAIPAEELAEIVRNHDSEARLAARVWACGSVEEAIERAKARVWACGSVEEAIERAIRFARGTDAIICAFGSLYYIGKIRDFYLSAMDI